MIKFTTSVGERPKSRAYNTCERIAAMSKMTVQMFREMLERVRSELEVLQAQKDIREGQNCPSPDECAAIEHVQNAYRHVLGTLKEEIETMK